MIKFTKQGYILSALLLVVLFIRLITWRRATKNEMMFEMHYNGIKAIRVDSLDLYVWYFERFDGTPNLVVDSDDKIYVSKNFGVDWEFKRELGELTDPTKFSYREIKIDQIYPSKRAYMFEYPDEVREIYYTDDAGENWGVWNFESVITSTLKEYFFDIDPNIVKASVIYPNSSSLNKNYLIARIYFETDGYDASASFDYISTDFGKNWKLLSPIEDLTFNNFESKTVRCNFNVKGSKKFNPNRVICEYKEKKGFDESIFDFRYLTKIYESEDLGESWTISESSKDLNVNDDLKTKDYTLAYVKKNNFNSSYSVDRYVFKKNKKIFGMSTMTNVLYHDSKSEDVEVSRYRVSDNMCILRIQPDHEFKKTNKSNIYPFRRDLSKVFISDTTGLKFYSFDEVTGEDYQNATNSVSLLPGLKDTLIMSSSKLITIEAEDLDNGESETFYANSVQRYSAQATKLSFDKGYSWSNIKVNPLDNALKDSIALPCDPSDEAQCTVINVSSHFKFPFFSHISDLSAASGILSLNGIVSKTDTLDYGVKNDYVTFISRDGGHSFDARLNFSTQVTVGDHGNILVAIPYSANKIYPEIPGIYYSLDQGKTWDEYQLDITFVPIEVKPVVKDGSGFHFLVRGYVYDQDKFDIFSPNDSEYMEILLDFSDIHGGVQCDEEKDMEIWELNNGECIDGLKHSYKRRKQFSKCSVNKLYEKSISETSVCECTEKDFECAPEFYRDFSTGKCILDSKLLAELSEQKCKNSKDEKISIPSKILKSNNVCRNPESVNIDVQELTCDRLSL